MGKDAILDDAKADPQMRVWHAVAKKQLTEFAVLVGAFRDSIRSRAQLKARRGQIGDVAGVHPSRVLERLMPMELAKMAHMPTRLYALDAYMKGKMLAYEHVEMIRQDRGPVAILLDRSGSMEHPADCQLGSVAVRGTKMMQAKSLCVALCIVLSEQGRDCCIIPFNQTSGKRIDWRWETPELQVKTLVLAFAVSPSGSTNFDPPVADGFRWRGDCDVLMVSDGVGAFTPARHPQLATRKLAYIVLGNDHDVQQDLKAAATWSMAVTSLDQAIETVAELAV
jgi:uncharacterized protein with von Willebrand factor type A (vWA) domain